MVIAKTIKEQLDIVMTTATETVLWLLLAAERAAAIFDQLTKADFNLANGGRIGFARGTPEDGIGSLNTGAESIMYQGTDGARSPKQTKNEQTHCCG